MLPAEVAEKIAAGEVVERPASVVKELVENSIDAGALRIEVDLLDGGRRLVRVADDGCGMSRPDAELAFARHATSKLVPGRELESISTLGFRGEALPSIAAVSRVELVTRRHGLDGVRVVAEGGEIKEVAQCGAAHGTVVTVRDLFASVPARLKFMRSRAVELGHASELLTRMALAYPKIGFFLRSDGREILRYLPVGDFKERIAQVFGKERARELKRVCHARDGIAITGAVLGAGMAFSTSRYLFTYVNRRLVRDRLLNHAILEGFATLIPKGRQPGAVIMVEIPPQEVDVNVHPAKHEVRFLNGHLVHERVSEAVRNALAATWERAPSSGEGAVTESQSVCEAKAEAGGWLGLHFRREKYSLQSSGEQPVFARATVENFSRLRFIGQVFEGYLVCERPGSLLLIDQHAAHERVLFEKLRQQYRRGTVERQSLLVAQTLDVGEPGASILEHKREELLSLGFEVEFFGDETVILRAVPALLRSCDWKALLEDVVATLGQTGSAGSIRESAHALLATAACHSAIRVGQKIGAEEAARLLAELDRIDFSSNCPHGRPVALELERGRVERWFGR